MLSPTLKKLRYLPGMRVAVLGAPASFEEQLSAASDDFHRARALTKGLDLVQAFVLQRAPLERDLGKLKAALGPKGILWLCYPKAKALGTDLNRDVLRELAATKGLEAVAIVAVDAVWSALRCKAVD